jgi:tetratricopeptide (TPR) repeat protein
MCQKTTELPGGLALRKKRWNSDFKVFLFNTKSILLIIIVGILLMTSGWAPENDVKQMSQENRIGYNEANFYEGNGDIYVKKGNDEKTLGNNKKAIDFYIKALEEYNKSEKLFIKTEDGLQIAEIKKRLGELYHQWGDIENKEENYREALEYLHDALKIAEDKNIPKTI